MEFADVPRPTLAHIKKLPTLENEPVPCVVHCEKYTKTIKVFDARDPGLECPPIELPELAFHFFGTAWVFLNETTLLLCGGDNRSDAATVDMPSRTVQTVANMHEPRYGHAIYRLVDIVYVFGGACEKKSLDTCEFYYSGIWGRMPWLPWPMYYATAARVNRRIFITGTNNLISVFDPLKVT
jgi:hypothetical protein